MYPTANISYGQSGADVTKLQNFLISQGVRIPSGATGYFGNETKAALTQWQNKMGITGSGIGTNWGPQSISKASTVNYSSSSSPPTIIPKTTAQIAYEKSITDAIPYGQPNSTASQTGSSTASFPTVSLQPGSTNTAAVKQLQDYLVSKGFMTQPQVNTGYGTYGPQTTAAVLAFQKAEGIDYSSGPGYWGPRTIASAPMVSSISPTQSRADYAASTAGQSSAADTSGGMPEGVLPPGISNLALYNYPNEAYKALVPTLVPGTSAYKKAMDKISTAYFDVMQQQMNASTEQEQIVAQNNWNQLKSYIEKNLNVSLQNDAISAWDQIQGLSSQYAGQNIEGSGIQTESVDDYLKKVRANDSASRMTAQTQEEEQRASYYQKFATDAQIKELVASDPDAAQRYGLIPSQAVRDAMNPAALKAKYPSMSDEAIQQNIASIMDANGNYRSGLSQRYMTGGNRNIDQGGVNEVKTDQHGNPIFVDVRPTDSGLLDINSARQQFLDKNTPLVSNLAAYDAGVKLGTIKPTVGSSASGGADTTLFNQIAPSTTRTTSKTIPTATIQKSIVVPRSMTTPTSTLTATQVAAKTAVNSTNTSGWTAAQIKAFNAAKALMPS